MPRESVYWERRRLGKCVECPNICSTARCSECQERRRLGEDRTGSTRYAGRGRLAASHRERKIEQAVARRGGPAPIRKELVEQVRREARIVRRTADRPRDGLLPWGLPKAPLSLDGLAVESWSIAGEKRAWPREWASAEVRLAAAPDGWRRGELRWVRLSWTEMHPLEGIRDRAQDVQVTVESPPGRAMRLAIRSVPS